MTNFVTIAQTTDLKPGEGMLVHVDGEAIALFRVGDSFYAISNRCTHMGGPLSEGQVEDHEVGCPWHGARFDLRTGETWGPPARRPVGTYEVKVEGIEIKVGIVA